MAVVGKDFLFIHNPKCAGKSLSRRLGGATRTIPSHAPLSFFPAEQRKDLFTFGFVRNPWDRAVSIYTFLINKPPRPREDLTYKEAARQMGFNRWLLESRLFIADDSLWQRPDLAPIQSRSQMFWVEGCDFIGKVETVEDDLRVIEARISRSRTLWYRLRYSGKLERRNVSRRSDYRRHYNDDSAEFIAHHFAEDIDRFGYAFDPLV
ncbi:MAG: sulfotransferase family 2 domain-containing protein [Paracoccaceae bacterium]